MIKVGFDISQIAHPGGVATYTKNIAEQLMSKEDLEMFFFYSSLRKPYKGKLKNVKSYKLPPTLFEMLFNKIRNVPIEKFLGPIDIFHSSDWVQPPSKAKKVTTIHDLVPLLHPEWSDKKIVAVHRRRLKIVEKEVDLVIVVSEATKKDLLEISNIPREKIVVVYEGVNEDFKPLRRKEVDAFRKKYNLPDKFLLGIGGVGERRNLKRVREASKGFNLVIAGETIPRIPDEEMPLLYNCAEALLYPSFYEGFGLPILEAQACGIPVITSNVSSMPEIAGDGAVLVDPEKKEEIKKSLIDLLGDQDLRKELVRKGFENVRRFSWVRCGEETFEVYKELMGKQ